MSQQFLVRKILQQMLPNPLSYGWTPSLFNWFWQSVLIVINLEYAVSADDPRRVYTSTIRSTVDVQARFLESFQSVVEKAVAKMYQNQPRSVSRALSRNRAQASLSGGFQGSIGNQALHVAELSETLAQTVLQANEAFRGSYTTETRVVDSMFTVQHFPAEQILEKGRDRIIYTVSIFVDPDHNYSFTRPGN